MPPGLLSGGTNVQSRSQELIPQVGRSPGRCLSWSGSWARSEGQWMPWAELAVCLSDPRGGQIQVPVPLSKNLESRWMLPSCTMSLLQMVGRAMLPPEALGEDLFPCLFQLLELHVFLGSWVPSPSPKPVEKHLQISFSVLIVTSRSPF